MEVTLSGHSMIRNSARSAKDTTLEGQPCATNYMSLTPCIILDTHQFTYLENPTSSLLFSVFNGEELCQ
jgi:hypothetical protein